MKRCKAVDPIHGQRCDKETKHPLDSWTTHVAGSVMWAPGKQAVDITTLDWKPIINSTVDLTMLKEQFATFYEVEDSMAAADELAEWWRQQAEAEIGPTVDKAIEYGSTDLIDIGMMLGRTMSWQVTEAEAAEMGVFFYLIGKIARWQSAIQRRELPSDDTLFDIGVYVRMAQRIRKSGGWPGVTVDKAILDEMEQQ